MLHGTTKCFREELFANVWQCLLSVQSLHSPSRCAQFHSCWGSLMLLPPSSTFTWVKMILCALTLDIHVCVVNQMTDTHSQALGNVKKCLATGCPRCLSLTIMSMSLDISWQNMGKLTFSAGCCICPSKTIPWLHVPALKVKAKRRMALGYVKGAGLSTIRGNTSSLCNTA